MFYSWLTSSHFIMLGLLLCFALAHSGLAALRSWAEKFLGARFYRILFALVSLSLAGVMIIYFFNHRYDGDIRTGGKPQQAFATHDHGIAQWTEMRKIGLPKEGGNGRARIEMRELLKELQRMGKTNLISSHILPELQDLCNKVGIIEQGELLYSGPWTDIVKQARIGTKLHVSVADNQEQAAALARRLMQEKPTEADRIRRSFSLCFSRPPDATERQLAETFFEKARSEIADSPTREQTILTHYCHALLSSGEFRNAD